MSDDARITSRRFQSDAPDWRVISLSGIGTWFDAPDHRTGAVLVRRAGSLAEEHDVTLSVDLRDCGVQAWIAYRDGWSPAAVTVAQQLSAAARDLGMAADPSVPQELEWGIDTLDKPTLKPFWQTILGYQDTPDDDLLDPLRRDPRVWFHPTAPRPLRDRVHLDVSVPRDQATQRALAVLPDAPAQAAFTRGWALLTDAEGNEVDLVPGDALDQPGTEDWRVTFGAMVFYPTTSPGAAADLVAAVAEVADRSGMPLLIDLRPAGVMIDTGKDRWEDVRFADVARQVQTLARGLGLVADPTRARFQQVCIDAVDVPRIREFWRAVLGYRNDPRDGVTDITDPRWLNHPMIFQRMDPGDGPRRRQRNRIHLDLYVPDDQVASRRAAALAAGGRLTRDDPLGTIADPEGNEVDIGAGIA